MSRLARILRMVALLSVAVTTFTFTLAASGAPAPTRITDVDAGGGHHTCALTTGGGVKCWGYNVQGQLGNGSQASGSGPSKPVDVKGLTSGVKAIAVGGSHSCALTNAGAVRCWGFNRNGQLGNGSAADQSNVPVDVAGLKGGVSAIAAGGNHTCALTNAGGVKCWGANPNGQLGSGSRSQNPSRTPVDVVGLASGIRAIAAGGAVASNGGFTCAVTSRGGVKCWGDNPGNDAVAGCCTPTPVDVAGLASGVTAIAAGHSHACAVTSGGAATCWGDNSWGQLGNGSRTAGRNPVDVAGLSSGVSALDGGQAHTCALTSGGGVKCWGFNRYGQVGNGSTADYGPTTPVDVAGLASGMTAIAAGQAHSCAVTRSGGVKCWGDNSTGQLGNGSAMPTSTRPVDVAFSPSQTAAPNVTLGAASPQRLLAQQGITVTARCDKACSLSASGSVRILGTRHVFALARATARLPAAGSRKLTLRFPAAARSRFRRLYTPGRRAQAAITVRASDSSRRARTANLAVAVQ